MTGRRRVASLATLTALVVAPSAAWAAVPGAAPVAVSHLAAGDAADALAVGELAGTVLIAGVAGAVAVVLLGIGILIGGRPRHVKPKPRVDPAAANPNRLEEILHRRLLRRARVRMETDLIVDALLDEPAESPPEPAPEPKPVVTRGRAARGEPGG